MGMNVGKSSSYSSEINVTPLVDVVLVLLIIFMVIVPLTQLGYDVSIPNESVSATPPPTVDRQIILSVSNASCPEGGTGGSGLPMNCQVRLNKEVCAASDLSRRVGEIFANRRGDDRVLFLAAEESLRYEYVVRLLDLAQAGAGGDLSIGIVKDERIALGPPETASVGG